MPMSTVAPQQDKVRTSEKQMMTNDEFENYAKRIGLSRKAVQCLENIRASPPVRNGGEGALHNVTCRFASRKMGHTIQAESRTCELAFVLESELDADVLEIWDQPIVLSLRRTLPNGRLHVSSHVPDFLVLRGDAVHFWQCKPRSTLEKLLENEPRDWRRIGDVISFLPADTACSTLGLSHKVYAASDMQGVYLANLEVLNACKNITPPRTASSCLQRLKQKLIERPMSVAEAIRVCQGVNPGVVGYWLATKQLYACLRAQSFTELDTFQLYACQEDVLAREPTLLGLRDARLGRDDARVLSPLLTASPSELANALAIFEKFKETMRGERPLKRNERRYRDGIQAALDCGESPIIACLPKFAMRGNRLPRLAPGQLAAMETGIKDYFMSGLERQVTGLLGRVDVECTKHGVEKISLSSLYKRCNVIPTEKLAMARQGVRGYHAARPPVDPRDSTIRSGVAGVVVHIDSTAYDARGWEASALGEYFPQPWIYVAFDELGQRVLGRWVGFGKSDRYALAMCIRDLEARVGFLPSFIISDRGSEYHSTFWQMLAARYLTSLLSRPAGAPRFGGLQENGLKMLNTRVAHRIAGSTLNDQKGRSADGSTKSRATARCAFELLVAGIDDYLFDNYDQAGHGAAPGTPHDLWEESRRQFPEIGTVVTDRAEFEILTSVPVLAEAFKRNKGIRVGYRTYTSDEVQERALVEKALEYRLNPGNPSQLFVQFERGWEVAYSNDCKTLAQINGMQLASETYLPGFFAANNRDTRRTQHERQARRMGELEASAAARPKKSSHQEQPSSRSISIEAPHDDWAPKAIPIVKGVVR